MVFESLTRGIFRPATHVVEEAWLITHLTVNLISEMGSRIMWLWMTVRFTLYVLLLSPAFLRAAFIYCISDFIKRSIVYGPNRRNTLDLYLPTLNTYPSVRVKNSCKNSQKTHKTHQNGFNTPQTSQNTKNTQNNNNNSSDNSPTSDNSDNSENSENNGNNTIKSIIADNNGKYPVVVFFSGGAWMIGYKAWGAFMGMLFAQLGVLFVSPDHRNFPQGTISDMMNDCSTAIKWTFDNIENYGGNKEQIFVVSQSAGAHISCLVLLKHAYYHAKRRYIDQMYKHNSENNTHNTNNAKNSENNTHNTKTSGQTSKNGKNSNETGQGSAQSMNNRGNMGRIRNNSTASDFAGENELDRANRRDGKDIERDDIVTNQWDPSQLKAYIGIAGPYNLVDLTDYWNNKGLYTNVLLHIMNGDFEKYSPIYQLYYHFKRKKINNRNKNIKNNKKNNKNNTKNRNNNNNNNNPNTSNTSNRDNITSIIDISNNRDLINDKNNKNAKNTKNNIDTPDIADIADIIDIAEEDNTDTLDSIIKNSNHIDYILNSTKYDLNLCPVHLFHGGCDETVPVFSTHKFANALLEFNVDTQLKIYPNKSHTGPIVEDPIEGNDILVCDVLKIIYPTHSLDNIVKDIESIMRGNLKMPKCIVDAARIVCPF